MTTLPLVLPSSTIEDWMTWEGRWELINGIPFSMSPMANISHQRVAGNAFLAFSAALENCHDIYVYQPLNYRISETTVFEPDMPVCRGAMEGFFITGTPLLILEVLSKSTEAKDRVVKYAAYEAESVQYYLMADPRNRTLEAYKLQGVEYEKIFEGGSGTVTFDFGEVCAATIDVARLWR